MFSATPAQSWEEAAVSCTNINFISTLTSVTSQAEMEFILSKMGNLVFGYSPHLSCLSSP